jgi:archaellum component FlaF (FlaF/FlaG flagellin family)
MSDVSAAIDELWRGDFLKRREEAQYLTGYLNARYQAKKRERGFVLAVNGDWGLGKSFMIERWSEQLRLLAYPVVMFNSWENDFTQEALVAFIAELNSAMSEYFKEIPLGPELQRKWMSQAKALLVPTLKVIGFAALKHVGGMGVREFNEVTGSIESEDEDENAEFDTEKLAERLSKVVEEELKSHNNVKHAIGNFKAQLSALVAALENVPLVQLPVFVFIDELDRCRPDYAIRLLEGIKHFFGIAGIYFIVATNLSELAHSVRSVYGEKFGGEQYLKRFFDMEYSLPEPSGLGFAENLMSPLAELTPARFINGFHHTFSQADAPSAKSLPYVFLRYATSFDLKLRDQQQAAKVLEAALLTLGNVDIHIHFLVFLVVLYQKNSQVYHNVARAKNISGSTGYAEMAPRVGEPSSCFYVYDSNREDRKIVNITKIAELYFSIIAGNARHNISSVDFPDNLAVTYRNGNDSVEPLVKYIEIVRRAGQFSE